MRSKREIKLAISIFMAIALSLFFPSLSIAGDLNPIAPPGPTMHTLDEIYRNVSARFTDNGNGTVTDNLTGLMWTKNANLYGQKMWDDALNSCNACSEGGYGDWSLPQIKELQSLIHYGFMNPALQNTAGTSQWKPGDPFDNVQSSPCSYWSSTTRAEDAKYAWGVDIDHGFVVQSWKNSGPTYVWCVRGSQ
jgi:hypothetical protein